MALLVSIYRPVLFDLERAYLVTQFGFSVFVQDSPRRTHTDSAAFQRPEVTGGKFALVGEVKMENVDPTLTE